jgi:chaperonin GroEL
MSDINITTKNPFDIIKKTVEKAVELVAPTYGPAGNKVIISKVMHAMVVDDGVQIMRDLELPDANEHAVLKVIREVAIKTNDRAGDGTTGSMIMLGSITGEVARMGRFDGHKIERELKVALGEATDQLKASAKPIKTLEDLKKVALISFDDKEVSELIAETWHKVGKDGSVTLDTSPSMKTTAELSEGITMEHGYLHPVMVNNGERLESIIEKPYILITDYRITEAADILPLMNKLAAAQKGRLVIIADNVEQQALATLIVNQPHVFNQQTKTQGSFQSVAIVGPQGDNKLSTLEDIALLTGGKVFSMTKGDKISEATIEDLGQAERFIAKQNSSVIIGAKGKRDVVRKAVADISAAIVTASSEREKKALETRLAFFTNKVAVIKVGAPTENEYKALRYKVEDAVNSVRSAFRGGVACGGGLALARLETSSDLLNAALKEPHRRLLQNMGLEKVALKDGEAINVVSGKVGKYMDVGVADPVDVLVAGVESAVSIACLLLTTSGMIVEKPQKIRQQ